MIRKLPISVVISTKNEFRNIEACLASLQNFDDVFVVDSNSTDETQKLVEPFNVNLVNFTWNNEYPKKKQWELDNLAFKYDWVLMLDADERVSQQLVTELGSLRLDRTDVGAYDLPLEYWFLGNKLNWGHQVLKRSLVNRRKVYFPKVDDLSFPGSNEIEGHYQPHVVGKIGRLKSRLVHADKDSISLWFARHNRYSDWEAHVRTSKEVNQIVNEHKTKRGRLFAKAPFRPIIFFLYSYVLRFGFLDGGPGFHYAVALGMYYWQISIKMIELEHA